MVLLDNLSLIGKDGNDYHFQGMFDGQGHTISNLAISSSSQFTGLFGYLNGALIRNVVLDSSCSVVSSFSGSNSVFIGGIIGMCQAINGPCVTENIVNMASISFIGNTGNSLYLVELLGISLLQTMMSL